MKSLEKMQERYEKELEAANVHKKAADSLKKQIDDYRNMVLQKKTQELKLSADEYDQFIGFLSKDKMTVLKAAEMVNGGTAGGKEVKTDAG